VSRKNPYSKKFIDAELKKVEDSVIFVALVDRAYSIDLLTQGHYVQRQVMLAVQMRKPVFLALEMHLPTGVKNMVRSYFPKIDKEIEYDGRYASERSRVMQSIEDLLQELFPEDEKPKANLTDAFNDPMHGLERIG